MPAADVNYALAPDRRSSVAYRYATSKSHKVVMRADILYGKRLVARFAPPETTVIDGEMTIQGEDFPERIGRITLADGSGQWIPTGSESHLWYGRKCRMYRGIILPNNQVEYVSLGVIRVGKISISSASGSTVVTFSGGDLSSSIERARFTTVYTIAAGTNVATAIRNLLTSAGYEGPFNFTTTSATTPKRTYQKADDRWKAAQDLAQGAGLELFFDHDGIPTLREIVAVNSGRIAFYYSSVKYDPVAANDIFPILKCHREVSDEAVYNHVIVSGESKEAVVRAEAKITNVNDPLHVAGEFGDVPYFQATPATTAQGQAQAMANRTLRRVTRAVETVTVTTIPNALLRPGDVIFVEDYASQTYDRYVVKGWTIPFQRGTEMVITTEKQRV